MVPTDLQGNPWPTAKADMVLNKIHHEVVEEFRKADHAKGVPLDGAVYKTYAVDDRGQHVESDDPRAQVRTAVDPVLASLKTDGETVMKETRRRYARFCGKPRDHSKIKQPAAYTEEDPMPQRGREVIADHVPWGDEPATQTHESRGNQQQKRG